MFLWKVDDRMRVTLQTEHMLQSGDAGATWGTERLMPPVNRVATVMAARNHDEGWRGYEVAPDLDPGTGLPYDFREVDRDKHAHFYGLGVDFLEPTHPHAALLISMHATGLYQGRYGVDDSIPPRKVEQLPPLQREFIVREEARQRRLREELELTESDVWHDYRLLQIWDRLSIFAVWGQDRAEMAEVPLTDGSLGERLVATRLDATTVRLDPFPYEGDELVLPVRMFDLPLRCFEDQHDWDEELARTVATHMSFRYVD